MIKKYCHWIPIIIILFASFSNAENARNITIHNQINLPIVLSITNVSCMNNVGWEGDKNVDANSSISMNEEDKNSGSCFFHDKWYEITAKLAIAPYIFTKAKIHFKNNGPGSATRYISSSSDSLSNHLHISLVKNDIYIMR